jgi:hypothetical protein
MGKRRAGKRGRREKDFFLVRWVLTKEDGGKGRPPPRFIGYGVCRRLESVDCELERWIGPPPRFIG